MLVWIGLVVLVIVGVLACLLILFAPRDLLTGAAYAEVFRHPATRSPKLFDPPPPLTVTLTQTPLSIVLERAEAPVTARIWAGVTASGIRVHGYLVDVVVVYQDDAAAFARERCDADLERG